MDLGAQTTSDQEARFRRELSPALFPSWQATCNAFGAEIAARPSLIALVGEPGAGKIFTLLAFAAGATGLVANLRSPAQAIEPGAEIDLVDNVDAEAMAGLKPFRGTRVIAIRPGLAQCVAEAWPDARIVTIQPMTARDIRLMLDVRRRQLQFPSGTFALAALARFERHSLGNPRRLDDLLFRSFRLVAANAAARIAPNHVEQAAAQLHAEAGRTREDLPVPNRETVQTILRRAETRDPGFAPQDRPARRRVPANVAPPHREPRTRRAGGDRQKPIGQAAVPARRTGRGAYALAAGVTMPVEAASFADAPWAGAAAPSLMVISAQASDGISLVAAFRVIRPMTGVAVLALNDRDEDFIAWAGIGISGYVEPEASADRVIATILRVANGEIVYPDRLSSLLLSHLARRPGLARPQAGIEQLTRRELDVIKLLADGQANKQIARRLAITDATVKNHVHSILDKLGLRSRSEAAAYFRRSPFSSEPMVADPPYLAPTRRHAELPSRSA